MKVKRLVLLMSALLVLVGCQKDPQDVKPNEQVEKKLYEGMSGEETYRAAIDFFNDNVSYYKGVVEDGDASTTTETYKIDGKCSVVTKAVYQEDDFTYLNYTITDGTEFHSLYLKSDAYAYKLADDYSQEITKMYLDYYDDNIYDVLDVQRADEGEQILLTLKVKVSQTYQVSDKEDSISYMINEMTINKDGYIVQEETTYYVDETFGEILQRTSTYNSQINQKTVEDFKDEIKLMKSCDGLSREDVQDKLGL